MTATRLDWTDTEGGRVAVVTLDLPGKSANLLSSAVLGEIGQRLDEVDAAEGVAGLVLQVANRGLSLTGSEALEVAAGEPWDDVVAASVRRGLQGLECLSGIPGLAGATPIQNVGAYGQDVAETIVKVRALDRTTLALTELAASECAFGYRDSRFKSMEPDRFVVLGVTFALRAGAAPALRYAELTRHFAERGEGTPSLAAVRDATIALRRAKSMVYDRADPNHRSCGSFFTNPVVAAEDADRVEHEVPAPMPRYPQPDGRVKLAAGEETEITVATPFEPRFVLLDPEARLLLAGRSQMLKALGE